MNIALEVSTIGLGQINKKEGYNRTGIYRVTTELSKALLKNNNINVFLLFWEFPHTFEFGVEYFKGNGYEVKTIYDNSTLENAIYKKIYGTKNIPHRIDMMKILAKIIQNCKTKNVPGSIDIFHSLYYPNPNFVNPRNTIRFRTIHDILPLLYPEFFTKKHEKTFLKNIRNTSIKHDWFFSVSQSTKDDLCNHLGISENRVFVNHLAASPEIYYQEADRTRINYVKKKLKIPEGEYFLNVATLEPRKNLKFMLKCFKNVLRTPGIGKDYYLVLTGKEGWLIHDLLQKIYSDPVLKTKIIITGFVPNEFLSPLYSGALAFLFPSLYEGFGLPVLEAMQCGTPVITSNTSSLPEVVGDAGINIDPKSEDDLCQAMIDVISNSELRNSLSNRGIERAKLFSWEKCAERTVQAYRFAMSNK